MNYKVIKISQCVRSCLAIGEDINKSRPYLPVSNGDINVAYKAVETYAKKNWNCECRAEVKAYDNEL